MNTSTTFSASKNIPIIASLVLIVVVGAIFFLTNDTTQLFQKEQIVIEQDLAPIELTLEEQQALQDEGLMTPPTEDVSTDDLRGVRSSDELDAIEADLNETDLSGLDAELDSIEGSLFGL